MFFAWLLYKLVFEFIIPVYRSTKAVRKQMNDIQQHMRQQYEEQQSARQGYTQQQSSQRPGNKPPKRDDYIDFEEIK
jgi:Sec-independent protein translocase protein TatA